MLSGSFLAGWGLDSRRLRRLRVSPLRLRLALATSQKAIWYPCAVLWLPIVVPIVLLVVATLLVITRLRINAMAFHAVIDKLLAANNRDRALKLCSAAPASPVVAIVAKGLRLELPAKYATSEQREDAAVEALTPEAAAHSARFMRLRAVALLGLVSPIAAALMAGEDQIERAAVSVVALFAAINFVRLLYRLERDVYAAVGRVSPHVRSTSQ